MLVTETTNNAWLAALRECVSQTGVTPLESRNGACYESIASGFTLQNPCANVVTHPSRKLSPYYGSAELLWYLSGSRHIDMLQEYAPSYSAFAEDGGIAYGAYGWRIHRNRGFRYQLSTLEAICEPGAPDYPHGHADWEKKPRSKINFDTISDQLSAAIMTLREKPESRQVIVSLWDSGDSLHAYFGDKRDLPCTLTWQFLSRSGKLHMIVTMRSNDVFLGLPYDVYCFTSMQQLVANACGLQIGTYHHRVGSLHVYEKDISKVDNIDHTAFSEPVNQWAYAHYGGDKGLPLAVQVTAALHFEAEMRMAKTDPDFNFNDFAHRVNTTLGHSTLLGDCVFACATKWHPEAIDFLVHPGLTQVAKAWQERRRTQC